MIEKPSNETTNRDETDKATERELDQLLDLLEEAADEDGLPNNVQQSGTG